MSSFVAQFLIVLETLISSKTRIKLLLKFFLNSNTTAYLRGLESEFGESSNAIRLELNRFEEAGMIESRMEGNKKVFFANTTHPLFREIHNLILKNLGFDRIIEDVIERLGDVERVYITGDFAHGRDSQIIDLVFVGDVDRAYLTQLVEKAEQLIRRKIRFVIYGIQEFSYQIQEKSNPELLLWSK
jgi:DNA-binding transcriptional ArsR family regulator